MHDEFRHIYTKIINVDQALTRLILEAYDNMYTSQLEDYLLQYANYSALEILMNLKHTYGLINPTQLAENYNKMTAPIRFQDHIETIFRKIEYIVRYANALTWRHNMSKLLSYSFLTLAPSMMHAESDNAVHQSTKLGLTSGENLHEPIGNNALSQAQPAVQGITLQMFQNTMAPNPFLLTVDL
jgi:hypothetical protein